MDIYLTTGKKKKRSIMQMFKVLKEISFLQSVHPQRMGKGKELRDNLWAPQPPRSYYALGRQHDPDSGERAWSLSVNSLGAWTCALCPAHSTDPLLSWIMLGGQVGATSALCTAARRAAVKTRFLSWQKAKWMTRTQTSCKRFQSSLEAPRVCRLNELPRVADRSNMQ